MGIKSTFSALPKNTKSLLIVGVLLALVVALPLFIWGITTQKFLFRQKAQVASGEPVPSPAPMGPVYWEAGSIRIAADQLYVIANGKTYSGESNSVSIGHYISPHTENIEITHNSSELGLIVFFSKDEYYRWRITQIQVHNSLYSSEWLTYTGPFPQLNLGQTYEESGNQTLLVKNPSNGDVVAEIHFTNLRVIAFLGETPPPTACPPYPMTMQVVPASQSTGINQNTRYNISVTRNDPGCMGTVRVDLSARIPNGWRSSFGSQSFDLPLNHTYSTYLDITPTTYNQLNETLVVYANTMYPPNSVSKQIGIQVGATPVPTPPNAYYCPGSEACPYSGDPTLLRSCHPAENDGTPADSLCNTRGRIETCGPALTKYCCPNPGSPWTTDLTVCNGYATPSPSAVPTATPTPFGNSCGGTCGRDYNCKSGLVCYQGFCRSPQCVGDTTCGCNASISFGIQFKFDGVTDGSADGAGVTARFVGPSISNPLGRVTPPLVSRYIGNGIYGLRFNLPQSILPEGNYAVILKGEKHAQARFCKSQGQTEYCTAGTPGQIAINHSGYLISLNFTGFRLPAGDTITQDGHVDDVDYKRVFAVLSKPYASQTEEDLRVADLNYSGRVDGLDMFLLMKTLGTRYDEY